MKIANAEKKLAKAGAVEHAKGENKWLRHFTLNGKKIKIGLSSANGCAGPAFEPEKVSSVSYEGDCYGISLSTAIEWASEKK